MKLRIPSILFIIALLVPFSPPIDAAVWRGLGQRMRITVQGWNGADAWSRCTRSRHYSTVSFRRFRVVLQTFQPAGTPIADTNYTNDYFFQVGFEYPYAASNTGIANRVPVTFSGSNVASYTAAAGPFGYILSDIIDLGYDVPADAFFGFWTTIENQLGSASPSNTMPYIDNMCNNLERYEGNRTTASSLIGSNWALSQPSISHVGTNIGGYSSGYAPSMMLIEVPESAKSILLIGDSICYGVGEGSTGSAGYGDALGSALGNSGYLARWVGENLRYNAMNFGRGSDGFKYASAANWKYRTQMWALANPTHIVSENFHNDVYTAGGINGMLSNIQIGYGLMRSACPGVPIIQTTCTPHSDGSSDQYRTFAGQSNGSSSSNIFWASNGIRNVLNEMIRTNDARVGHDDYIDPNPWYEDGYVAGNPATTTGRIRSDGTAYRFVYDGIHPGSHGTEAIAAGMTRDPFAGTNAVVTNWAPSFTMSPAGPYYVGQAVAFSNTSTAGTHAATNFTMSFPDGSTFETNSAAFTVSKTFVTNYSNYVLITIADTNGTVVAASNLLIVTNTNIVYSKGTIKYIIFKLDDFNTAYLWNDLASNLISNNIHASFGFVGSNSESYAATRPWFWDWVTNIRSNGIEIWNHSYDHGDMSALDEHGQFRVMARNQNIIRRYAGLTLAAYGAPGNYLNSDSYDALQDVDAVDTMFFGVTNSAKRSFLRCGEMESPTLVPNYDYFISNWSRTVSNVSNAGADYLILQGHPGSWGTGSRLTNFQYILGFLTNMGFTFVTPSEYVQIKTGGLSISNPTPETVFAPGATVSGSIIGTNPTWSVDLLSGTTIQNLASGSGSSFSAVLPVAIGISNRVRITARSQGFSRCQTHAVAPIGTNDLAATATMSSDSQTAGYEAAKAVDRSLATAWKPSGALPQSITADFGAERLVAGAYIAWKPDRFADFWKMSVSTDGSNWFTIVSNDTGIGGGESFRCAPTNARYIRLTAIRAVNTNNPVELSEFFALESDAPYTNMNTNLIVAEADTYASFTYQASNYGAKTSMIVQNVNGNQGFLRFNVGITNTSSLARARLFVYPTGAFTDATNTLFSVADNTWDEMTVTWTNKPVYGTYIGAANANAYRLEYDVTAAVSNAMGADGKVSFALISSNSVWVTHNTRDLTNYGGARAPAIELSFAAGVIPAPTNTNAPSTNLSLAITNPSSGRWYISNTSVTFAGTYSTNGGLLASSNGSTFYGVTTTNATGGWSNTLAVPFAGAMTNIYYIVITNASCAVTNRITNYFDSTPPVIALTNYTNGVVIGTNGSTITYRGTNGEDASSVSGTSLFVNGTFAGWTNTAPQISFTIDTTSFTNGPLALRLVVSNTAGNTAAVVWTNFVSNIVTNVPPVAAVTNLANQTWITNGMFTLRGYATNAYGLAITNISLSTNGTTFATITNGGSSSLAWFTNINVSAFPLTNRIWVAAVNALGIAVTNVQTNFVDTTPPAASITNLTAHQKASGTNYFCGTIMDTRAPISSAILTVSNAGGFVTNITPSMTNGIFTAPWDTLQAGITNGTYFIRVTAVNAAGLATNTMPISFEVSNLRAAPDLKAAYVFNNPYTGSGDIVFKELPTNTTVSVYSVSGRLIAKIVMETGDKTGMLSWDVTDDNGRTLSPGVYLCYMHSPAGTRKMKIMIKRQRQ
ncbi:MAG: discoidin domain-containing protein [Spirochaetes bacterium]|nr:discoidin domain-containing protein [Spirochaetota bacterium]